MHIIVEKGSGRFTFARCLVDNWLHSVGPRPQPVNGQMNSLTRLASGQRDQFATGVALGEDLMLGGFVDRPWRCSLVQDARLDPGATSRSQ